MCAWLNGHSLNATLHLLFFYLDCRSAIGIDANIRSIPDKSMTASSEYNRHFAYEGRLNNAHRVSSTGERNWGAWCPKKSDVSPYLQVDQIYAC